MIVLNVKIIGQSPCISSAVNKLDRRLLCYGSRWFFSLYTLRVQSVFVMQSVKFREEFLLFFNIRNTPHNLNGSAQTHHLHCADATGSATWQNKLLFANPVL